MNPYVTEITVEEYTNAYTALEMAEMGRREWHEMLARTLFEAKMTPRRPHGIHRHGYYRGTCRMKNFRYQPQWRE